MNKEVSLAKKIRQEVKKDVQEEMKKNQKTVHQVSFRKGATRQRQGLAKKFKKAQRALPHESSLHAYDKFTLSKMFPGAFRPMYFANSHATKLPVQISNGTYTRSIPSTNTGYTVMFFSPPAVANNASRWSGVSITDSVNILPAQVYNTTVLTNSGSLYGALTMTQFYQGDFLSISNQGFIYSADFTVGFVGPQANWAPRFYAGEISYAQLNQGISIQNLINIASKGQGSLSPTINEKINIHTEI